MAEGRHEHDEAYAALVHPHPEVDAAIQTLGQEIAGKAAVNHPHPGLETTVGNLDARITVLEQRPAHEPELANAVVVASKDWPWPSGAHFVCDGVDDHVEINQAIAALPAFGGKIVFAGGTFVPGDFIQWRSGVMGEGFGWATVFKPAASFPANQYVMRVYLDDRRPLDHVSLNHFMINGVGITQPVHGLEWACFRGGMLNVEIQRMTGDGMNVHNTPGVGTNPNPWNGYESVFENVQIHGCLGYGLRAKSTDQHWNKFKVHSNYQANIIGSFGGSMITNFHFYGGDANAFKKQTIDNVIISGISRTRIGDGKIEHAVRRLMWLHGDPKGGDFSMSNVGFRNGSGEGSGMWPQIMIDRSGGNTWKLGFTNCWFDVDYWRTLPDGTTVRNLVRRNIEVIGDSLRHARIDACSFHDYEIEPFTTPKDGVCGTLSTFNGFGTNAGDPNLVGSWKNNGEWGVQVVDELTGKVWRAVSATVWA